jgi:hypothetical protein
MNFRKNTSGNRLDDERLENCLRVATSQICSDINVSQSEISANILTDIPLFSIIVNISRKHTFFPWDLMKLINKD